MLYIQQYLRSTPNPIESAVKEWGLLVDETEDLIQLNYSMVDSPRGVRPVDECRGLILEKGSWDIVAYPFRRFYNHGEGPAACVKSKNATLQEKLDGSLITLYNYKNIWHVATRGRIFADGPVGEENRTFHDLFYQTVSDHLGKSSEEFHRGVPSGYCYVFELTAPDNRVITPYQERKLTLLLARETSDWNEVGPDNLNSLARELGVNRPKTFNFSNKQDIVAMLSEMKGLEEGFVLIDYTRLDEGSFKRIKMKSPSYLQASRLIGNGFSGRNALGLILHGDPEEFLSYFPEHEPLITEVRSKIEEACSSVANLYERIRDIQDRGQFAREAIQNPFKHILFGLRDEKINSPLEGLIQSTKGSDGLPSVTKTKGLYELLSRV